MEEMELDQRWGVFTNIFTKKEEFFLILHSACPFDTLTGERARGMKRLSLHSPICDVSNKGAVVDRGVIHTARLRGRPPPPPKCATAARVSRRF